MLSCHDEPYVVRRALSPCAMLLPSLIYHLVHMAFACSVNQGDVDIVPAVEGASCTSPATMTAYVRAWVEDHQPLFVIRALRAAGKRGPGPCMICCCMFFVCSCLCALGGPYARLV